MYTTKNYNGRADLFPQIDNVLNTILNTTIAHATYEQKQKFTQPSSNVKEFGDRFEIYVAIPGFDKSDVKLKVEKKILSVSAENENNSEGKFHLKEFNYGSFNKKFKLPLSADALSISAEMINGILIIEIPKRKDDIDQGPKTIEIG